MSPAQTAPIELFPTPDNLEVLRPGVYGFDRATYDKLRHGPDGYVNFSTLKQLARSPAHYRHEVKQPPADPKALDKRGDQLRLGLAIHLRVLEPALYPVRTVVFDGDRRAGARWEIFEEKHANEIILTEEQHELAEELGRRAALHPLAGELLEHGTSEVTVIDQIVERPINGVGGYELRAKARLDRVVHHPGRAPSCLLDLKTTSDAAPDGFDRTAWNLHYLEQAAWYVDRFAGATGLELPISLIALETRPPYAISVYDVTPRLLQIGRRRYRDWLGTLAACARADRWPEYFEGRMELPLPGWVERQIENEGI